MTELAIYLTLSSREFILSYMWIFCHVHKLLFEPEAEKENEINIY